MKTKEVEYKQFAFTEVDGKTRNGFVESRERALFNYKRTGEAGRADLQERKQFLFTCVAFVDFEKERKLLPPCGAKRPAISTDENRELYLLSPLSSPSSAPSVSTIDPVGGK